MLKIVLCEHLPGIIAAMRELIELGGYSPRGRKCTFTCEVCGQKVRLTKREVMEWEG